MVGLCPKNIVFCACQYVKNHRLPFSLFECRATHFFALVHTDLWGLTPIVSTNGARYFYYSLMIFLDFLGFILYMLKIRL